jgi:mRNA deadenylase 3'-5' endonuclease subunit Ccr4
MQKQKQRVDQRFHEPMFSNLTKDFKGTLDYILYTNNFLQARQQQCQCKKQLVCPQCPSASLGGLCRD